MKPINKKTCCATILAILLMTVINSASAQTYVIEDRQSGSVFTQSESPQNWILEASKNWMSYIPDHVKLKHISIPGTHDSGARYGGLIGQCQTWTITEQLQAGIRFLDIRCRPTGKSFAIHHGAFFQNQMFGDVMNEITAFLRSNPTETVIIHLKSEHTPQEGSDDFQDIWDAYAERYENYLYQGTNSNETLGNVRGKIFVMCNANCSGYGMGYGADSEIQNRYKVYWLAHKEIKGSDWATLPSKSDEIENYITKALTSSKWVLNFLSGAVGMTPPDVARSTNNTTYEYLKTRSGKRKLGIMIMDFPGEQLIYRVLKSNFDFRTACNCSAKTFRSISDHSWVEFRLPQGLGDQTIDIPGGAYNHYVFPKCNRVHWNDLQFKCNPNSCNWEKASGSWGADGLCHGSPGSSPYVVVGNR